MTATEHRELDAARVESRALTDRAREGRAICREIALPLSEAAGLHREGWLSFDPAAHEPLDAAREAELFFVGSLVVAGCSRPVLRRLLAGLRRPFCYDVRRMFFDWASGRWRVLPGEDDPEGAFFGLLDRLRGRHEREVLAALRGWIDEALDLDREQNALLGHDVGAGPPRPGRPSIEPG